MMANGIMAIVSHKPFTVLLSSFSPVTESFLKKHCHCAALKAPERIITVDATESRFLQPKKGGWTADFLDSSDKDSLRNPTAIQNSGEMPMSAARKNFYGGTA